MPPHPADFCFFNFVIIFSKKITSQVWWNAPQSQLFRRLRQEAHLSPGVWGQAGQYSETPFSKKKKQK
jgi:hypothetical protein